MLSIKFLKIYKVLYCNLVAPMMEFSNPSFHLRSRDISNEEKDLICQQVLDKVKRRENREVVSAVLYIEIQSLV